MNEIVTYEKNLPATLDELVPYVLIGEEKIKVYTAKLSAVRKLGLSIEIERAALSDAQRMGKAVIYAKVKVGELLKAIPPKKGKTKQYGSSGGTIPSLPPGISKRTSHQAQTIANNPKAVAAAIAQAIQEGDIPTPVKVYKLIKAESIKARNEVLRDKAASLPVGKYSVILADPPWQYSNSGFNESAESQYPTMPTDKICEMAELVNGWSTPETVLFLWATNPLLPDALKVLEAWGFAYKTNMAWVKDKARDGFCNPGMNCCSSGRETTRPSRKSGRNRALRQTVDPFTAGSRRRLTRS